MTREELIEALSWIAIIIPTVAVGFAVAIFGVITAVYLGHVIYGLHV